MNKKIITTILAAVLLSTVAGAQALVGSYFLDNSIARNRLNPAFSPRANYFGLPAISNLGVGLYGNIGPADFLYPKNGQLYTFLNSNVSVEEFSKRLNKYPGADIDFDTDLLNFGFYTSKNSFWSVDFGMKVTAGFGVPADFFMLLKKGMNPGENIYSMKGFFVDANASAYAAIGHSHDLSNLVKGLKIGGKLRFYVSMAHANLDLGQSTMQLSSDKWTINAAANGTIASTFLKVAPAAQEGQTMSFATDFSKLAPAGYGLSLDLGAEYRLSVGCPLDGLTFSFAALDLGAFLYKSNNVQRLKSQADVNYVGIEGFNIDQTADLNQIFQKIGDDFMKIADFEEVQPEDFIRSTYPKIYAGVEMPFANNLMSMGLLYSGKFGRTRTINELTLSYNLNPCKWFNMGLNWSFLNSRKALGWILEFSPKGGIDLFIGSDYTFFDYAAFNVPTINKLYLPVDKVCTNVRFGLTFMVGSKHRK